MSRHFEHKKMMSQEIPSPGLDEILHVSNNKPKLVKIGHSSSPRKPDHGNQTPGLPEIPSLNERETTKELLCHAERTEMSTPYSVIERRVTLVKNTMQGHLLRKSTKKLQDDLRQTMRTYSSEKQQLMKQLANLRHEMDEMKIDDRSSLSPSTLSDYSQKTNKSNKSRYFHAPDIAAQKVVKNTQKKDGSVSDRSNLSTNRTAVMEHFKDGVFKLPAISGPSMVNRNNKQSTNSSIWYSGNNLVEKTNFSHPEDQTDSSDSAEMMKENYSIPKINDPTRNDITMSKNKQKVKDKKRVHFANFQQLSPIKNSSSTRTENQNVPKNLKSGEVENLPQLQKVSKKQFHKVNKKFRAYDRAYTKLPPIDEVKLAYFGMESQHVAENYKALYVSITNPEERMKTLADILYAVRLRMQENEQNLKYGESPRYGKSDNTLCDFLLKNNQDKSVDNRLSPTSDVSKQLKQLKGVPNNTAARMGRRSTGIQLQNYLRKMSRSRRMIEHMQMEEIRLAQMGHQHLVAASRA